MILEYTKNIPKKIPKVLKKILGLKTKSLFKLKGGEVSYVFRVETDKGLFAMRIFRYDLASLKPTLYFADKTLNKLKIRHQKIIYFDNSSKYFRHGFMLAEWIEGINGEAVDNKIATQEEIVGKVTKILKKIHTIKFNRFGHPPFNKKNKGYKDFRSYVLNFDGEKRLQKMIKEKLVSQKVIESGIRLLHSLLDKINIDIKPVMVHGDASPHNIIWTRGDCLD